MNDINKLYGEINSLKEYLNSTDYMIIKSYESDYTVPDDILTQRQSARERINEIEAEIFELKSIHEATLIEELQPMKN